MDLDEIAAVGEQKARSEQYKLALEAALAAGDDAGIRSFIDHGGASLDGAGILVGDR